MSTMTRRIAMLGAICSFGGCSTITALNAASVPLDTYDLRPVSGKKTGPRSSRTLLVANPQASAALATDRIMVRPDAASITYLPDARWGDAMPAVLQSLLIRSISGTGRIGYVGRSDTGPVPDRALLVRIDAFEVEVLPDGVFQAKVDIDLTLINDQSQRVVGSRMFSQSALAENDNPRNIVASFQGVLDIVLPAMADWTLSRV